MSTIRVRKYETNGRGFIRAEVEWDAGSTQTGSDTKQYEHPDGEIASFAAIQKTTHVDLAIYPEDVPDFDSLRLPIVAGQPLPKKLVGCTFPSMHYDLPYVITPLDDTPYGFGISIGLRVVLPTPLVSVSAKVGPKKKRKAA